MAKASFTLIFFLLATFFGLVSAHPLERRDVAEFKRDLNHVDHSIQMFDHEVSFLDAVPSVFPVAVLVGLEAISQGFGELANDLTGVDYISDGDSDDILRQIQGFVPAFLSSMNRMSAIYQIPHDELAKRDAGKAIRDVGKTLRNLANNLRNTVRDLVRSSRNNKQKAAYQQAGNQMLDAVQEAYLAVNTTLA